MSPSKPHISKHAHVFQSKRHGKKRRRSLNDTLITFGTLHTTLKRQNYDLPFGNYKNKDFKYHTIVITNTVILGGTCWRMYPPDTCRTVYKPFGYTSERTYSNIPKQNRPISERYEATPSGSLYLHEPRPPSMNQSTDKYKQVHGNGA